MNFLMNRFSILFTINRFYRILGAATAAEARRQIQKPPGASSIGVIDKSYREVSSWNDTLP